MVHLFIVRHTKIINSSNLCYGRYEIDLGDSFELESEKLYKDLLTSFDKFSVKSCSRIITSPSQRCIKLAVYLSNRIGVEIQTDDRLLEYNFGSWEGKPWEEIPQLELKTWMDDFTKNSPPDGETLQEFRDRVNDILTSFRYSIEYDRSKHLIIITHSGVIRMINSLVLGYPMENLFRFEVGYGQIYKYSISKQPLLDKSY